MSSSLSIRKVTKIYTSAQQGQVLALEGCSLEIARNEFSVLVGPSGCGKTTLLNIIAGFDTLTEGEVTLNDAVIASPGIRATPGPDRLVVFQHGGLFPWMTALQNVCYGPVIQKQTTLSEARKIATDMLAQVGLRDIQSLYPGDMSSGMRRRVEIIRAIIGQPKVLLMDEPFRALDALTKTVVQDFLLKLYDTQPRTIFFITHDLIEAIFLADKVSVMTTRPGRMKKIMSINLPRPRSNKLLDSPEFLRLKDEVTEAVHEEAVKAFETGEREAAR